jgi:prepilin-type N-terminal cleavage/methylation domain-containing protein
MKKKLGFTLIELVITMFLLGVSAVSVLTFIGEGTMFFVDTTERVEISMFAQNTLQRIKRQVVNSVPYSLETSYDNNLSYLQLTQPVATSRIINVVGNENLIYLASNEKNRLDISKDQCNVNNYFSRIIISSGNASYQFDYSFDSNDYHKIYINDPDFIDIYKRFSTNTARVYFIDSCSIQRYFVQNKILKYQYGYINNGTFVAVATENLSNDRIKVSEMLFNITSDGDNFVSASSKNKNDVLVGILIESGGEVISISQFMEVLNAS